MNQPVCFSCLYEGEIIENNASNGKDFIIKKMTYCDNNVAVKFTWQNKQLIIEPCAFEYSYNTIVRVVEIE